MNARKPVSKILVGVDGSESAREALEWTIKLAQQTGAEVVAVFALPLPNYLEYSAVTAMGPIEYDPGFKHALESAFLEEWSLPLKNAGVKFRLVFQQGAAAPVIAHIAESEDVDLVVVGRRGLGGLAEMVMGSVSHQLAHHCPRPVLVVSHHKEAMQPVREHATAPGAH